MKRSRSNQELQVVDSEPLEDFVEAINSRGTQENFEAFVELFRKLNGKIAQPICNLMAWRKKYLAEIYVIKTDDNHLELCINRISLINNHGVGRKRMQCFDRCLATVKPKLIVLQSTHSHANPIKRYGFQDPLTLFGSEKSSITLRESKRIR